MGPYLRRDGYICLSLSTRVGRARYVERRNTAAVRRFVSTRSGCGCGARGMAMAGKEKTGLRMGRAWEKEERGG